MKKISIFLILLFIGCDLGVDLNGNKSKDTNATENNVSIRETNNTETNNTEENVTTKETCVSVYTLGNVVDAVVVDSNKSQAEYNKTLSKYCFKGEVVYPIEAKVIDSTYIDVDYNNKKTSNDIKPKFVTLKSYFNEINFVTDMHARAVDENITQEANSSDDFKNLAINYYANILDMNYSINLNNNFSFSKVVPNYMKLKILNFVAYDYYIAGKLLTISADLFKKYNDLVIFFDNYLINKVGDPIKYYSLYHSLELLDKGLIQRIDTLHIPDISYLHSNNLQVTKSNSFIFHHSLIAKDIKIDAISSDYAYEDIRIYVASGTDGVVELNSNLEIIHSKKVDQTFSNSYNLDILNTNNLKNSYINNKHYLLVADGGEGIDFFDILGGNFIYKDKIFWKYYDEVGGKDVPISIDDSQGMKQIDDVISVKTYVSPLGETIWCAFGTQNQGLFLVDCKKIIPKMDAVYPVEVVEGNTTTTVYQSLKYPIIVYNPTSDVNNTLWIPGDGDTVYAEEFSSDGENLYATKKNTIERYDLSSLLVISKPVNTYNIQGKDAYNLKMVTSNGADELFVSTDEGVEVYNVLNNYDLEFISKYTTAGAREGYQPKMTFISEKNILLFTDGYQGLKAIKYDSSYNPSLCGIGYFYPYSDPTKLAKVTSVDAYKDLGENKYYVVVGIDGFGVAKFKLDDILFKHCK